LVAEGRETAELEPSERRPKRVYGDVFYKVSVISYARQNKLYPEPSAREFWLEWEANAVWLDRATWSTVDVDTLVTASEARRFLLSMAIAELWKERPSDEILERVARQVDSVFISKGRAVETARFAMRAVPNAEKVQSRWPEWLIPDRRRRDRVLQLAAVRIAGRVLTMNGLACFDPTDPRESLSRELRSTPGIRIAGTTLNTLTDLLPHSHVYERELAKEVASLVRKMLADPEYRPGSRPPFNLYEGAFPDGVNAFPPVH
jgi:hypothetical protein